jgi:hypothetical protein
MRHGCRPWGHRSLLVAFLAGVAPLLPGVLAGQALLIDAPGMWSLERLGYGELRLTVQRSVESTSVQYRLPDNAMQGVGRWYLAHLDAEVAVSPDTGDGFAILGGATNGRAALMATIEVSHENGQPVVSWEALDEEHGARYQRSDSLTFQIHQIMYLQNAGVQPGLNTMSFSIQQFRGVRVTSVRILPTSGIEVSDLAPPRASLQLETIQVQAAVGEAFTMRYTVTNTGGQPARHVRVTAMASSDELELLEEQRVEGELAPGEMRSGAATFRGRREGRHRIYFLGVAGMAAANGLSGGPSVDVVIGNPPPPLPSVLTDDQVAKAKATVVADRSVQQIADGTPHEFEAVGLWASAGEGARVLGAVVVIRFPHRITVPAGFSWPTTALKTLAEIQADPSAPPYHERTMIRDAVELSGLQLLVDLDREQVVGIRPAIDPFP